MNSSIEGERLEMNNRVELAVGVEDESDGDGLVELEVEVEDDAMKEFDVWEG